MKYETRTNIIETVMRGGLSLLSHSLKDGKWFMTEKEYVSRDFYLGTEKFLDAPAENNVWSLGSASVDLTPLDWRERQYYLGGYMVGGNHYRNLVEDVVDDMQGRAIAVDDGSGRGISVFCTVDCIGITNYDIRKIRRKFADKFAAEFPEKSVASINVFATHSHSCIDTEGPWTDFPGKMLRNMHRNHTGKGIPEPGADEQYLRYITERISDALLDACRNMTDGEMFLAQKDITTKYFVNKNRPSATGILTDLTRLRFVPFDKTKRETMIVNLPAHPDVAGFPVKSEPGSGRRLCGEYVRYIGETLNEAGYDFMFFNGAICAIYMARGASNDGLAFRHRYEESQRFGEEIGKMTLALTKTVEEIKKDPVLYDEKQIKWDSEASERNGGKYTLWCEDWTPVEEIKVKPFFNIRLAEVRIPVTNDLIVAMGKLKLANYDVLKTDDGGYAVYTEIGYIEFGDELRVVMVPGEFCCDLLVGGASLSAAGSWKKRDFGLPPLRSIFREDVIAFGLANDGIGYIVPDNDYTLGDPWDHYHESVSLGEKAGSSVIKGFLKMKEELFQ